MFKKLAMLKITLKNVKVKLQLKLKANRSWEVEWKRKDRRWGVIFILRKETNLSRAVIVDYTLIHQLR